MRPLSAEVGNHVDDRVGTSTGQSRSAVAGRSRRPCLLGCAVALPPVRWRARGGSRNGGSGWPGRSAMQAEFGGSAQGRCPDGWLDERAANVAARGRDEDVRARGCMPNRTRAARWRSARYTVRELGAEWLEWLREVRGAKPSTLADYAFLLREPGQKFRRGSRVSAGRIMAAFGDRPAAEVTTRTFRKFLRALDREGLTPRNVNKHRQVLGGDCSPTAAAQTLTGCLTNPVDGTDKRREVATAGPRLLRGRGGRGARALLRARRASRRSLEPSIRRAGRTSR